MTDETSELTSGVPEVEDRLRGRRFEKIPYRDRTSGGERVTHDFGIDSGGEHFRTVECLGRGFCPVPGKDSSALLRRAEGLAD